MNNLTPEQIEYIIERVIKKAADTQRLREENTNKDNDLFYEGMLTAYHEVLDTIKNQLEVYGVKLSDFGLDIDIEEKTA